MHRSVILIIGEFEQVNVRIFSESNFLSYQAETFKFSEKY